MYRRRIAGAAEVITLREVAPDSSGTGQLDGVLDALAFDALIDTLENLGLPSAILGPEALDDASSRHS